jgi:hypothetical protein
MMVEVEVEAKTGFAPSSINRDNINNNILTSTSNSNDNKIKQYYNTGMLVNSVVAADRTWNTLFVALKKASWQHF